MSLSYRVWAEFVGETAYELFLETDKSFDTLSEAEVHVRALLDRGAVSGVTITKAEDED